MTARTTEMANKQKGSVVQRPGSQLKTRKRRERRLKARFGKDYVPLHERVVTGLKALIDEQFPVGDQSKDSQTCRAYWLSHVRDIKEELDAEVWEVHSIVAERWRQVSDGHSACSLRDSKSGVRSTIGAILSEIQLFSLLPSPQ